MTSPPATRAAATADEPAVLDEQGHRSEGEQEGRGAEGGTPPRRRLPGLEVSLDDVGHRLDDVVVDARHRVVDPGGHGDQPAVLDALDDQAGVTRERAALGGDEVVAAVDRRAVEQADAARQLGHQLGDRDGAGEHEVDAARARGDGDPDQARRAGRARRRLAHRNHPFPKWRSCLWTSGARLPPGPATGGAATGVSR